MCLTLQYFIEIVEFNCVVIMTIGLIPELVVRCFDLWKDTYRFFPLGPKAFHCGAPIWQKRLENLALKSGALCSHE